MDSQTTSDVRTPGQRALIWVGSIGPIGRAPASGTVCVALVGIPLVWLMQTYLVSVGMYIGGTACLALAAVAIHQVGDRVLGVKDSRLLVWDELVGFAIAMTAVPMTWRLVVLGFLLERAIDIAKVYPANVVERRVPGGWGVVGDDVVAGLYTLGALHLACAAVPGWVGLG
ncbi:MAG: phosphatidylglycerophosphatase A [Phycisphaerae bacterium]